MTAFGGLLLVILARELILSLKEGSGENYAGANTSAQTSSPARILIFPNPLVYSAVLTVLVAPLAIGQFFMMRIVNQLKLDYVKKQNKPREDLDLQILSKKDTSQETELLDKISYDI